MAIDDINECVNNSTMLTDDEIALRSEVIALKTSCYRARDLFCDTPLAGLFAAAAEYFARGQTDFEILEYSRPERVENERLDAAA